MSGKIKPGLYKHFKGKDYGVIGESTDTETGEIFVVYKQLYHSKEYPRGKIWHRSKKNFLEKVVVDDKKVPRFEFVREVE